MAIGSVGTRARDDLCPFALVLQMLHQQGVELREQGWRESGLVVGQGKRHNDPSAVAPDDQIMVIQIVTERPQPCTVRYIIATFK